MGQYEPILETIEYMLERAGLKVELGRELSLSTDKDTLCLDYVVKGPNGKIKILQDLKPVISMKARLPVIGHIDGHVGIYPLENLPADCGLTGEFETGLVVAYEPPNSSDEIDMAIHPDGQVVSHSAAILMAKHDYREAFQVLLDRVQLEI